VSITIEAAFCVDTLEEALAKHGKPDINAGQGSQFTGATFTGLLIKNGISGRTTACPRPAHRLALSRLLQRALTHSRLDRRTPDQAYFTRCPSAWRPNHGRRSTYRRGKLFRQPGPPQRTESSKNSSSPETDNSCERIWRDVLSRWLMIG
jgi:hypothetical protein